MNIKGQKCYSLLLVLAMVISLIPAGALSVFAEATGTDFSEHFTAVSLCTEDGKPWTAGEVKNNETLSFKVEYQLNSTLTAGTAYTFSIPAAVATYAKEFDIKNGSTVVATGVVVDASTGTCTLTYNADAETNGVLAEGTVGEFFITTTLDADKIPNGTKELVFFEGNTKEIKIGMDFVIAQIKGTVVATKAATVEVDKARIKWVVTVTPELLNANAGIAGDRDITNLVVNNTIASGLTYIDTGDAAPTVTKKNGDTSSDAGVNFTLSPDITVPPTTGPSELKCTFPTISYQSGDIYTITYYTSYDISAFASTDDAKFTNSASGNFTYPQYGKDESKNVVLATNDDGIAIGISGNIIPVSAKAEFSAQFLSKTESLNGATHIITWTVTVNGDALAFTDNYNVTDVIPKGLTLKQVWLTSGGGAKTELTAGSGYTLTANTGAPNPADSHTLTIPIAQVDSAKKHIIEYTTKIADSIWKNQPSATFKNSVSYTGKYGGEGYGFSRAKEGKYNFGGTSGGLISAGGTYDRKDHTFTWTVGVNGHKATLNGGVVTLVIPDGLTYVPGSLAADKLTGSAIGSIVDITDLKKLVVTLPISINAAGGIVFKTTLDDVNQWATNAPNKKYSITANLKSTADGINLSATPEVESITQVIAKEYVSYNHNTKEITWKVTFNQNQMAMTLPVVTDTLQEGLAYVVGSATATGATLSGTQYDAESRKLTLSFNSLFKGGTVPTVTFKTKVVDENLLKDPSKNPIKNKADITFTELAGGAVVASAEVNPTIGTQPLIKSATKNDKFRNITWTVAINPNQIVMNKPAIEDTLPNGLLLDMEDIKLYEATVNDADGKLTKGAKVYDSSPLVSLPTNGDYTATLNGQKFTFGFKNQTNKAYVLEFTTDNVLNTTHTYKNTVSFQGSEPIPSEESSQSQGGTASGSTNPNRGSIELIAYDVSSGKTALAGTSYTFTGTKPYNVYKATTDAQGKIFLPVVKLDTYTVTTDSIPAGYGTFKEPAISFEVKGLQKASTTAEYKKGVALVTLDYNGNGSTSGTAYPQQSFASGATVTVLPNPFAKSGNLFRGWNTAANGTGTAYAPTAAFDIAGNTTLYAQWSPASGTVVLSAKEDGTSQVFENLTYTITDGTATYTATTDSDGKATFANVGIGNYTLSQGGRPDGYVQKGTVTIPNLVADGATVSADVLYEAAFTLDYEGNTHTGGTKPDTAYFPVNATVTVGLSPFAKNGFTFEGWNTEIDASGTAYKENDTFAIMQNTILYAEWKIVPTPPPSGGGDNGGGGDPPTIPPVIPPVIPPIVPPVIPPIEPPVTPPVEPPVTPPVEPPVTPPVVPEPPTPEKLPEPIPEPAPSAEEWNATPSVDIRSVVEEPLELGTGGLILTAFSVKGEPVAGVVFEVVYENTVFTATSDTKGIAVFRNIAPGDYEVTVTSTPVGYTFASAKRFSAKVYEQNYAVAEATLGMASKSPNTGDSFPLGFAWLVTIIGFFGVLWSGLALYTNKRYIPKRLLKK